MLSVRSDRSGVVSEVTLFRLGDHRAITNTNGFGVLLKKGSDEEFRRSANTSADVAISLIRTASAHPRLGSGVLS